MSQEVQCPRKEEEDSRYRGREMFNPARSRTSNLFKISSLPAEKSGSWALPLVFVPSQANLGSPRQSSGSRVLPELASTGGSVGYLDADMVWRLYNRRSSTPAPITTPEDRRPPRRHCIVLPPPAHDGWLVPG